MALLLLPAVASAQLIPTPQPGTAIVVVSVFFNGSFNQNGPPVTLNLHCTAASVAPDEVVVLDPAAFEYEQAFILSQIPDNVDNVCTVTSAPVADYSADYECGTLGYSSLSGECDGTYSDESCVFDDIQIGDTGGCIVNNDVDPVEVVITKEWDITNAINGGNYYSLDADIEVTCDGVLGMEPGHRRHGKYEYKWKLEDGDYTDGIATLTLDVYPYYDGEGECWAKEDDVDSAVEISSTCGNYDWNLKELVGTMDVDVGQGNSCTITNTLFFEGIPTLNQYGMAIMALLMLGVGFVGFRRFV
jgi:hypothetical protein